MKIRQADRNIIKEFTIEADRSMIRNGRYSSLKKEWRVYRKGVYVGITFMSKESAASFVRMQARR